MPTQPQAPSPANHSGRARLRKALTNLLNDEELRTLCFDLEINYDTLPGREINGKIQELIARFEKAGRIPALIAACRELRPHADWDEIAAAYAQAARGAAGADSEPPAPLAEQQAALDRYLRALRLACNALPLAALADDGDPHRRAELTLNRVYIALDTTTQVPVEADAKAAGKAQRGRIPEGSGPERELRVVTVLEAAATQPRLVILGDPGSGKSTFTNYLGYLLAGARLGEAAPPDGWPHGALLPLRFLLRDLVTTLPAEADLDCLPAERCEQTLCEAVQSYLPTLLAANDAAAALPLVRGALDAGQCLVIFDGLDEAPPDRRRVARLAVEAFARRHAGNRTLVSCRVRSYQGEARLPSFADSVLAPFDEPKIAAFVAAWYSALAEVGQMPRGEAEQRTGNLNRALQPLRELAENPLLLTTMAVVHTAQVELPRERVKLYQRCVEVLLRRWHKHKAGQVPVLTELGVSEATLLAALWEVAHAAQTSGGPGEAADVPCSQALKILARRLGNDYGKAQRFLEHVDERAGLLVGRGGVDEPVYTFPHRTFQEYLAGCHLALGGRDFGRRLRSLLPEGDRWALATRLGVEHLLYNVGDETKVLDALYRLCPVAAPQTAADWRGIQWAGDVAVELGAERIRADIEEPDGGPALLARLIPRLLALIEGGHLPPAERAAAGAALGRLGDPRFTGPYALPDFVPIPAGVFWMGSDEAEVARLISTAKEDWEKDAFKAEAPRHQVELDAFAIARYPTTNAMFRCFMAAGGYADPRWWAEAIADKRWAKGKVKDWQGERDQPYFWDDARFDGPTQPVVGVTWYEAAAYCRWLTATLNDGHLYRLPTEAEWERAARGPVPSTATPGDVAPGNRPNKFGTPAISRGTPESSTCRGIAGGGRRYPWGDDWADDHCNSEELNLGRTTPVGVFPAGASAEPERVHDLAGNVWEWCSDWYDEKAYAGRAGRVMRNPIGAERGDFRVLRGGSWGNNRTYVRCAFRDWIAPVYRNVNDGFRVARSSP